MKRTLFYALMCVMIFTQAACGAKSPPNTVHSPDDISGKDIGVLAGSPSARLAEELGAARPYSSGADLMSALTNAAVDCVLIENTIATILADETPGVRVLGEPLLEYELRFAVAKENAELKNAINSALAALTANGTLDGLRDKYFGGKPYSYVPPEDVIPHPGVLTLAISTDDRPFSYIDANGNYSGLNIQIAVAVCNHLGVELEVAEYETGELITAVWYGKADIALGWLPGDVLDRVNLSEPYADSSHVILVRK